MSDFVLTYNSNFTVCTDRAEICFKCYIEKERKYNFEKGLVKRAKAQINGLVEGLFYATIVFHVCFFLLIKCIINDKVF